ncbi:MAG: type II 3-dehydroquinate dehydratase [Opitutales bacterium]|nr:type II 3-dehydroquinate dehydratase [Opitutales bacterium]
MKKIAIINGANLNRLGVREPEIYGRETLESLEEKASALAASLGVELAFFQSNHEGDILDKIAEFSDAKFDGAVINPGAFTHTSVALRDAISGSGIPFVEVHISNINRREEFRRNSITAPVCVAQVCGMGFEGYMAAIRFLAGGR